MKIIRIEDGKVHEGMATADARSAIDSYRGRFTVLVPAPEGQFRVIVPGAADALFQALDDEQK